MADGGKNAADKALAKLDKKIQDIYSEAAKDIQKKFDTFRKNYKIKDAIYKDKLHKGEITQEDYDRWYNGQVFQSKQWQLKKYDIEHVLENSNEIAVSMINNESIHVFSANVNYQEFVIDKTHSVNFGFELYDSDTVTNLIKNDPKLLPEWKVNEPKDYIWNGKKVDRQIALGIMQGENIMQIGKRLAENLSSQNKNKMMTFARTAMTGAQNAGRYQGLKNAKQLGLEVVKEWMATLDLHTRDSHKAIDGEQQKVGDKWHPFKFSNGCRYPGDPEGPAKEVYGCRCTLVGDLVNFPAKEYERYDNIDGKPVKNMSYEDWYNAKMAQKQQLAAIKKAEDELKKLGNIKDQEDLVHSLELQIKIEGADKVFSGIWKDNVTYKDWENKKDSIQAKKAFYTDRINNIRENMETHFLSQLDPDARKEILDIILNDDAFQRGLISFASVENLWNSNNSFLKSLGYDLNGFSDLVNNLDDVSDTLRGYQYYLELLDEFNKNGQRFFDLWQNLDSAQEKLNKMYDLQDIINGKTNASSISNIGIFGPDAYTKERKDNALWTNDKQKVDDVLRPAAGKVWQNASDLERKSIHKYTYTYHMFNEPLRGIEYGTSRTVGVGNADLDAGSEHNGRNLNAMTDIIEKSRLPQDQWFQRGTSTSGASKFLGIDYGLLANGTEEELKNALLGTTPTEYGFMSMGSSKGAGFSGGVHFYIYAPKGTKAMYVEPFSRYGGGDGWQWDGKSKQFYFGDEFETILQQGTQFRVTRVRRKGTYGDVYIDIEVIGQDNVQRWKK